MSLNEFPTSSLPDRVDVVVIGAGLAGLAAAATAARGGASVLVLERSTAAGGRATTQRSHGFSFNLGPHALYRGGPATAVLAELGVTWSGRKPPVSGGLGLLGGRLHTLPAGLVSLLTTDLLSLSGKVELAGALSGLPRLDTSSLRGRTLGEWLESTFRDATVRALVRALMRLTSYADDPTRSCAAAAVAQLQGGLGRGVSYVDGGWATLVDGLAAAVASAGGRVATGHAARAVRSEGNSVHVLLDGAREVRASVVVLAAAPSAAANLVEGEGAAALRAWADGAVPVKAACLDLGLSRLPKPRRTFALGIDRPCYFSVHSASAALAPEGGALVHVARYLGDESDGYDAKRTQAELEEFCDLVQPGWRAALVERRFLPSMTVVGDLVQAGAARATVEVPGASRLFVAGDWVGEGPMLADASLASGRTAGSLAVRRVLAFGGAVGGAPARANARGANAMERRCAA